MLGNMLLVLCNWVYWYSSSAIINPLILIFIRANDQHAISNPNASNIELFKPTINTLVEEIYYQIVGSERCITCNSRVLCDLL